ncbi:MAG: helix-turn-helix domain-containing protein [Candidatus Entotheonellia bacterium]
MALTTNQIHVGDRLRQLRAGRGLSVRSLATRAGFSPSFISQVEHGQVSPSIASLERIAAVLGVTLGGFFTEPSPSPVAVVRAPDRQELTSAWSRAKIEALGPAGGMRTLEPIMITLAAGGRTGTRLHAALAEQFALVCDGEVTLTLPESTYTLRQGDAVSLAAETPHQWENTGSSPARLLIVSTHAGSSGGKTSS